MNIIYFSNGFIIHPHLQAVEQNNQMIAVRPKTFALLLLMLEQPQEILSKKFLLDSVWDDVTVDEPVLVQSIRELRQLLGASAIQTYPRKGYAWSLPVEKKFITSNEPSVIKPDTQPDSKPQSIQTPVKSSKYILAAILLVCIFIFAFVLINHTKNPSANQVIIVLPIKNEILGSDHAWVELGAMDQLIHLLKSGSDVQVMDTEYVLNFMQTTHIQRNITQQAETVLNISGASLVVETKLSGSVEEYRLDYKLHIKNDIKLGSIFDNNLHSLLQKLSSIIANNTGGSLNAADLSQQSFKNELMARALEQMDLGNFDAAKNLLTSLKLLEPDNIIARRRLAQSLLDLKNYDLAKKEAVSAITIANPQDSVRLKFLLAEIEFNQGLLDAALTTLDQAQNLALSNHDILYLAYIFQLKANIQQAQGSPALAYASYQEALTHFSIIRCPIGMSITHMKWAQLLQEENKHQSAHEQFIAAKTLIEDHHLYKLEPWLTELTKDSPSSSRSGDPAL